MGYSLSWAAVKNGKPEAIHALLGLRATDVWENRPKSKTVGTNLPTGWYVVLFKRKEVGDRTLTELSSIAEVVYCFVEDHVMFSRASGWKDGEFLWSVTHDCEKGGYHLEIKGDAPLSLKSIHAKLISKQDASGGEKADVDYIYDTPAELAKDLTGFRHDQDTPGMSKKPFQVLEKKTFFSRLFGGNN